MVLWFLGFAGFYRQFIQNFPELTDEMNKLTRKNVKFDWSEKCNASFVKIKELLIDRPILAYPDFDKPFALSTDASNIGIGAVLSQKDSENNERPVYYAGRSLNNAERNYSSIERELLAIVYATEKFKYDLYGKHFTIHTDHNPLVYLKNLTLSSERLTRWRLKLAEYDFDVVHRKGVLNGNADALSRIELPEPNHKSTELLENILAISQENHSVDKITYQNSLCVHKSKNFNRKTSTYKR